MEDDKGMAWVDCRKTRAVVEEWRSKSLPLKALGPANRLQSITGTNKGARPDFVRVRPSTLQRFAEGCKRSPEEFSADPDELRRWRTEQANQVGASGGTVGASDATMLQQLSKRLCGFYELYHNATSKNEGAKVSVSLLHVNGFDPARAAIQCELHDNSQTRPYFHLVGHVSAIAGFLHWALGLAPELIVCHGFSYFPVGEKYPGFTLYGIFLALSGDDKLDYPVAARGALRFLGDTAYEAIHNSVFELRKGEGQPEDLLRSSVGGYLGDLQERKLLRPDVLNQIETKILPRIDNVVTADATPRALIVPR